MKKINTLQKPERTSTKEDTSHNKIKIWFGNSRNAYRILYHKDQRSSLSSLKKL